MENDSSGNTQIVLRLIVTVGDFRKMSQQVVELERADREAIAHVPVDTSAQRRRERRMRVRCGEHSRTGTRRAKQHLAKWRDLPRLVVREARTEHIGKNMVVHVHAIDFADLIAAEIGHTAEPIPEIIGRRSAASVEIESPKANLSFMKPPQLFRFCSRARERLFNPRVCGMPKAGRH